MNQVLTDPDPAAQFTVTRRPCRPPLDAMLCRPGKLGSGSIISIRPNSCGPSARQHRDAPNPHGHPASWNCSPSGRNRAEPRPLPKEPSRRDRDFESLPLQRSGSLRTRDPLRSPGNLFLDLVAMQRGQTRRVGRTPNAKAGPSRPCSRRRCNLRARGGGCAPSPGTGSRKPLSRWGDVDSNFHVPVASYQKPDGRRTGCLGLEQPAQRV